MIFYDNEPILVSSLLLIPIVLIASFYVKSIPFIPIGDLVNVIAIVIFIVPVMRGNILKTIIVALPIIYVNIVLSAKMAYVYTNLAKTSEVSSLENYNGLITSSLNGGNPFSLWIAGIFQAKLWALILIPVVVLFVFIIRNTKKIKRKGFYNSI